MATSSSASNCSTTTASASISATTGTAGSGSSTVPAVIRHAYGNHKVTGDKQTAKCNLCGSTISEKKGITSSFTRKVLMCQVK